MSVKSYEHYFEFYQKQSAILNMPKANNRFVGWRRGDKERLQIEIDDLTNDKINRYGKRVRCLVNYLKEQHARELRKWKKVHGKSFLDSPDAQDTDYKDSSDVLNKLDARIAITNLEVDYLKKRIRELEKAEETDKKKKIEKSGKMPLKKRLSQMLTAKYKDGELALIGGRPVIQKNGIDIFSDDGSKVGAYVQDVKGQIVELRNEK